MIRVASMLMLIAGALPLRGVEAAQLAGNPQIASPRAPAAVVEAGENVARPGTMPWLGVLVSPANDILRHQLGLEGEAGLVIDYVDPSSPAARSGLTRYDLLLKLDDQLLVNADQLRVLLSLRKEGDSANLEVFRRGKRDRLAVTLAPHAPAQAPVQQALAAGAEPALSALGGDGWRGFSITLIDGGTDRIVVTDEKGQAVYEGGYRTAEERARVPEAARAALDGLLASEAGPAAPKSGGHVGGVLTLADGLSVTASSTHGSTRVGDHEGPPAALVDGDPVTRWSSAYADRQEVTIDLGKPCPLAAISLLWETAAAKTYRVELSDDGKTWKDAGGREGEGPGPRDDLIELGGVSARYLRLQLRERATRWGFSLYEVMIHPKR